MIGGVGMHASIPHLGKMCAQMAAYLADSLHNRHSGISVLHLFLVSNCFVKFKESRLKSIYFFYWIISIYDIPNKIFSK